MLITTRKGNWMEIIVPKNWEGKTMEEIFRKHWGSPRKLTHSFRMGDKVLINGNRANWNLPLVTKDKLLINLFEEEQTDITATFYEIEVLYEDDHLIVINKPPFMNTHPNDNADKDTLVNAVLFYIQTKGETGTIRHVHRLDRDTSGAILFAKHQLAGAILDRMLEKREIKRTYIAKVHGPLKIKRGTINEPIGRDRHHPTKRRVSPSGQDAITHYQVMKVEKNTSYVTCWLETGKTHQIRVHLSHIGHPIVGDVLYGGTPLFNRQALHAAKLEFVHPFTEDKIICYAPFIDKPAIFSGIDIYSI